MNKEDMIKMDMENVSIDYVPEEVKQLIKEVEDLKSREAELKRISEEVERARQTYEKIASKQEEQKAEKPSLTTGEALDILEVLSVIADCQRNNLRLGRHSAGNDVIDEACDILSEINKAHKMLLKIINKNN